MYTLQAGKQHGVCATLDASYSRLQGCSGQDANHGHSHLVVHGTQDPIVSEKAHTLGRNNGQENAIRFTGQITHALNTANNSKGSSEDGTGRGVPTVAVRTANTSSNGWGISPEGPAYTLDHSGGGQAIQQKMAVRRLTPVECERLQGFPDNYTLIPTAKARAIEEDYFAYLLTHRPDLTREQAIRLSKDGPRYKAIGNSMAGPVMEWIGNRIKLVSETLFEKRSAA